MRTNYVLIDYENVQPDILPALGEMPCKVLVFVGANQSKVARSTAVALQRMGSNAGYVEIAGNGLNALDFHIAFYIGRLAEKEPGSFFHIISKDTGFDPLIKHLRGLGVWAERANSVAEIPLLKRLAIQSTPERVEQVREKLRKAAQNRPISVKTLGGTINALFLKRLTEAEIGEVIKSLATAGDIAIDGTKVIYPAKTAA